LRLPKQTIQTNKKRKALPPLFFFNTSQPNPKAEQQLELEIT